MKSAITILSLIYSINVFAYSVTDVSAITSASPLLSSVTTTGLFQKAQANVMLNDAQEILLTGKSSMFLSQKIRETQDLIQGISEAEALDILIQSAQIILSK